MTNSRAKSSMQLIESYTFPSALASKTFTFPAIDFEKVSHLILEFDLSATAALSMELKINSIATAYYLDGGQITAAGVVYIDQNNVTEWTLADTTIFSAANAIGSGTVKIFLSKSGTLDYPQITFQLQGSDSDYHHGGGHTSNVTASITNVVIETDTSTFQAGGRLSLYKVLR